MNGVTEGNEQRSAAEAMRAFLTSVLPDRGVYFIATPRSNGFAHIPCSTIAAMVEKAFELDVAKKDAYFACASYAQDSYLDSNEKRRHRTRENAGWAKCFWIDVDCGKDKVAVGLGYATPEDAAAAVLLFVKAIFLPQPTVILSGGGLHCYWPLTAPIEKDDWTAGAEQLKRLMADNHCRLLADPARTADIASILRPPGTHNWKPERGGAPVQLLRHASPIPFGQFKNLIDRAEERLRATTADATTVLRASNLKTFSSSLSLEQLQDALRFINPECSRDDWWPVIAGVTDEFGEEARALLKRWSSGELQGRQGKNYSEDEFERQYCDLLKRKGTAERPVTIASVVARARDGGWIDPRKNRGIPEWVAELNREYAWIEQNASIYRFTYRDFIDSAKFKTQFDNQSVDVGTAANPKPIGKGTAWIKCKERRQHRKLTIRPGERAVTADNCVNEWAGFAVQSVRGNVKPFLRLLRRLVPDRTARRYVLRWVANLIQRPAIKMHVSLAFWSHVQGVGKNLLFETIRDLIGEHHATLISQDDLTGTFNSWAHRRTFVIGDEVYSCDRRSDADKLKGLITGSILRINEKYQPAIEAPNLLNFVFLSNHNDAVFLDGHDRRYFVWEVQAGPLEAATAQDFVQWRNFAGLSALRYFLEHVDISSFDPKAPAPPTEAKRQMIEDSRSDLEAWLAELTGSNVVQVLGRELATANELGRRYATENNRAAPSAKTVVGTCKNLGAHSRQVRVANGKKIRALAIARVDLWKKQSEAAWANELAKPLV